MIFKVVKGVQSPIVGDFWNSNSPTADIEKVASALDKTSSHRGHYKNRIVNNWKRFNPQEVNQTKYN